MNKEFIPYEQALELKKLGFNEPCFGEYRQWDGNKPYLQLYQDLDGCSTDPADYEYTTECYAPTYSQAFKWFREKGLHSAILPKMTPSNTIVYYIYEGKVKKDWDNCFNTYEEAELACLKKLIEIVKGGDK
jgi:hypothetical protein